LGIAPIGVAFVSLPNSFPVLVDIHGWAHLLR
jgi:hypothetical protein